jgi:hypothetical protein
MSTKDIELRMAVRALPTTSRDVQLAIKAEILRLTAPVSNTPWGYKAEFLWPPKAGSVEEAGYEFANAHSEEYRQLWWNILLERTRKADEE